MNCPDDSGWFWFKSEEHPNPVVVFISDDGIATFLNENGDSGELDDLIGVWEQAEISI